MLAERPLSGWLILIVFVAFLSTAHDKTCFGQFCPEWFQRLPQVSPSSRTAHAMAFDSHRGVAVMFGGQVGNTLFGDTWEWNGQTWQHATSSGPLPRHASVMAYDSYRKVMVLFGGRVSNGVPIQDMGDTWEWDGRTWVLRSQQGPTPRSTFAMAYDSHRRRVVLFGGASASGFLGDTWEWDGREWTQRSNTGPSPRSCHSMAYDSVRQVTVLFGGSSGPYLNDTWEWDGNTWLHKTTGGPAMRCRMGMVFDEARGFIALYGGAQLPPLPDLGDLWTWDGYSWRAHGNGGWPRSQFGMAYDSARQESTVFSGSLGIADTWSLRWIGPVIGDATSDCWVNRDDLEAVIEAWGACATSCPPRCIEDMAPWPDGDCVVDVSDLLLVIANWTG